ncbi:DegV family protein [Ligilactobacillus salitolerans]|uniref:DegV family protein n=2 Tax=Ligilactobacillus salitolerans TaxID=1808352 RepID=A0A401ITS3_9LACO|nr:DegV family protein [Ligilactobacillus salitolerans]
MKIAILTDSAAWLSEQTDAQTNIRILEIPLLLNDQAWSEGQLPAPAKLAELARTRGNMLTEEQIPLTEILALLMQLYGQGFTDVLIIHIAHSISGLGSKLHHLADHNDLPLNVQLFDSRSLGESEGLLVEYAASLVAKGKSLSEILPQLEQRRAQLHTLLLADDLKDLHKMGSIARRHTLSGQLAREKSILKFSQSGELEIILNSPWTKKIIAATTEMIGKKAKQITLAAADKATVRFYRQALTSRLPQLEIKEKIITPTVLAYAGPQAVIISWQN